MEGFANGLKTYGAIFQRLMDWMLGNLQPRCAVVYIDDITIFSPLLKQHLQDLRETFERLQNTNLKLDFEKCKFALSKVKALGHLVSQNEIRPDPKKTEFIWNLRLPRM